MTKAIIKKELRENLKVGMPGLLCFILLVMYTCHAYETVLASAASGVQTNQRDAATQPLMSIAFLLEAAGLTAFFGVVLGWMQINSERNRDLWAFLMHRPISRTRIFLGKTIAGLALYLAAAGVPLAGFVLWDVTPGHVAAPFEWGMVMPLLCLWLSGIAFYFAGMLTVVGRGRWYVSRALGIGLAVVSAFAMTGPSGNFMWEPPLLIWPAATGLCVIILGTAAWGSFVTGGLYRGQSAPAKGALTLTLMIGSALAVALIFGLASKIFSRATQSQLSEGYVINREGTVYRESSEMIVVSTGLTSYASTRKIQFYDLSGHLVLSEKTGLPLTTAEFYEKRADASTAYVSFGDGRAPWYFSQGTRYFSQLRTTPDALWYFRRTTGRVVGYDTRTRLMIGSFGPGGFARDQAGDGQHFAQTADWGRNDGSWQLFQTPSAVYEVDLDVQSFRTNFTTTPDDPIGGTAAIGRTNIIIVTRNFVHLLTGDGQEQAKVPYQPGYPNFAEVSVSALQPAGRFAVWFVPTIYTPNARWRTHAVWLAENGAVTNAMDLPDLPLQAPQMPTLAERTLDKLSMVPAPLPLMLISVIVNRGLPPWTRLILSLCGTVASVGVGWWLGRRYSHTRGAQIGWGIFHLLFNLTGLLAFVFVQEWPAREKCPNCQQPRVVDNQHCEHCGAEFAPAEKNGTEIIEPLGAIDSRTV